jgi:ion channel POLLUX/CASTOR
MPQRERWSRLRARIIYQADQVLSWHPAAQLVVLILVSLVLVSFAGLAISSADAGTEAGVDGFPEGMWWAFLHIVDGGTIQGDRGPAHRVIGFVVTLLGLIVFGLLVGFLSSAIQERLESLRRGRSQVLEDDHVLVLGFSPKVGVIARELADLGRDEKKRVTLVILSRRPKEWMEERLRRHLGERGIRHLRVVCRTGSPSSPADLAMVQAHRARAVIALARRDKTGALGERTNPLKVMLALRRQAARAGGKTRPRSLAMEVGAGADLRLLRSLCPEGAELKLVEGPELTAQLMVQTMRQGGLCEVYHELLSYRENEFYLAPLPEHWLGARFDDVLESYPEATVVGIMRGERPSQEAILCPGQGETLRQGDALILLAVAARKIWSETSPKRHDKAPIPPLAPRSKPTARILILGWRREIPRLLSWIDGFFGSGTEVTLLTRLARQARGALAPLSFQNLGAIVVHEGEPTCGDAMERCRAGDFDQAIVLADESAGDPDGRVLASLLNLRRVAAKTGRPGRLISEIMDPRTMELADDARGGDAILSTELISMALAQIAMGEERAAIFANLLEPRGTALCLVAPEQYLHRGEEPSFRDLVRRARAREEVAIGILYARGSARPEIVLNPSKDRPLALRPEDRIIVTYNPDEALQEGEQRAAR